MSDQQHAMFYTMTTAVRLCIVVIATLTIATVAPVNAASDKGQVKGQTASAADANSGNRTLAIEHVSSTTSSISIRWVDVWNVTSTSTGSCADVDDSATTPAADKTSMTVKIRATSLSTNMMLISPAIDGNLSNTFTLPDLAVDSAYRVCVLRQTECTCTELRTIPMIRMDSLLAVVLTIAFIVLLILLALVCWRCAVYCASRGDASSQHEPSVDDDKVAASTPTAAGCPGDDSEKAPLLVPGGTSGPSPNNDQQPASLYMYLTAPAVDLKKA